MQTVDGSVLWTGPDSLTVSSLRRRMLYPRDMAAEEPQAPLGFDMTHGPPLVHWVARSSGQTHSHAVLVGPDADGGSLYVGRALHEGHLLPGKVAETHRVCYVAWDGREHAHAQYEVLVVDRGNVQWERARAGDVPSGALPTGLTQDGHPIYSARAECEGVLTPGKLVPEERAACISYNTAEYTFEEYEVLTLAPA